MALFGRLFRALEPHRLVTVGDQLVVFQGVHHALFLDRTITDALGGEAWDVRRQAAFEATHALLASLYAEYGIVGPGPRLDLASELFTAMGHGKLELEITAEGGAARGTDLLFGAGHVERYASRVRNRRALDAFAAGFISAAASLAYPSDWGALEAEEHKCVAKGDERCEFVLTRRPERPRFGTIVTRPTVETIQARAPEPRAGYTASAATEAESETLDLLFHLAADDHGVARAADVRLAMVPVSYTAQIAFDALHLVEKRTPELFPAAFALVREASEIGAFHLLGGVLASPEWTSTHVETKSDLELRLEHLVGVARALGWGGVYTADYVPKRTLVLRSSVTHESAYYAIRHGTTVRARLAAFQGLALAIMHLLHRVDFDASPPIEQGTYDAIHRFGPRYHVEETRSPLRGDRVCEVVVEAMADR